MIGLPQVTDPATPGRRPRVDSAGDNFVVRHRWRLGGQVQGVGFRPAVFRWAQRFALTGFVRNEASDVVLELQGPGDRLDAFQRELLSHLPPLACIERQAVESLPPVLGEHDFQILDSQPQSAVEGQGRPGPQAEAVQLTVDTAVCDACLAEMASPADRRFEYPLINCMHCGPRYSMTLRVPYDRQNTSMAPFALCPTCAAEYANPADRRYHAQPVACAQCGSRLAITTPQGTEYRPSDDQVFEIAARLFAGEVIAIQGIGGFHLAVRATNPAAVARLRQIKHRDAKPLALLCGSLQEAEQLVELTAAGRELLTSAARPIVLAPRRHGGAEVAPQRPSAAVAAEVAPENHRLGVMLAYTPMQHLLFRAAPDLGPLVMTSCNESDEPLAITLPQVAPLVTPDRVSAVWWHERAICRSVDDSVVLDSRHEPPQWIRRSRGFVPRPWRIPHGGSQGLCLGGELKNTVAIVRDGEVVLSQHLGDLSHPAAIAALRRTVDDLCHLYQVRCDWIAVDLHPGYPSSRYGAELAERFDLPLLKIQHHHAHAAATMAEWNVPGPVLALTCDGVGYGDDGGVWGGELLVVDDRMFRRIARLRPLRLAGADAAARDTRRCGLAILWQLDNDPASWLDQPFLQRWYPREVDRQLLAAQLSSGAHCVDSSSLGRLFDGFAAIAGLGFTNRFEGEAAQRVEAAAFARFGASRQDTALWPGGLRAGLPGAEQGYTLRESTAIAGVAELDFSPFMAALAVAASHGGANMSANGAAGRPTGAWDAGAWAAAFHEVLAAGWADTVLRASAALGIGSVVLGGGVFVNEIFTSRLRHRLERGGLRVFRPTQFPPNDGGLALGQAAIAAARFAGSSAPVDDILPPPGASPCV